MKAALLKAFPSLYQLRIRQLRVKRFIQNLSPYTTLAKDRSPHNLNYVCKRHQSLLRRRLGSSDPRLQENKVTNLGISIQAMNGILIRPGETFSFWKLIGKPTASKGYIEGLLLSQGEVKTGIGGGLCQMANLLYWLALHSPLEVSERHHHSFDPFPDERRVLPFGSGASVFYNYIDLRFFNPTSQTFQFNLWITDKHLKGILHIDSEWPYSYHLEERNHQFLRKDNKNYRENEIWRKTIDKANGLVIKEELLIHNHAEVKYEIQAV